MSEGETKGEPNQTLADLQQIAETVSHISHREYPRWLTEEFTDWIGAGLDWLEQGRKMFGDIGCTD